MVKLTAKTIKSIKLGDVVKFYWDYARYKDCYDVGVIYVNNGREIKANCENGNHFEFNTQWLDGSIEFEILEEHAPVAIYGTKYDFVSNRK